MSVFVKHAATPCAFTSSDSWVILSPIEQSIKRKIESVGTPLKDWGVNIYRGILTGCNEAFIIDEGKRAEILANCQDAAERERTEQIIRPILRGRDVKRYAYNWAGLYLLWVPWHFPLHLDESIIGASAKAEMEFRKQFPAVYKHLCVYKEVLSKRNQSETGIRYEWYALQRWGANYWDDFSKPKIVWGNLSLNAAFAKAPAGMFINAPCVMITPFSDDLLAVLNSKLGDWYIRQLGVTRNGGYFEYKPMFVEQLPVPKPLKQISSDADIYELYGLTESEISFIEEDKHGLSSSC